MTLFKSQAVCNVWGKWASIADAEEGIWKLLRWRCNQRARKYTQRHI